MQAEPYLMEALVVLLTCLTHQLYSVALLTISHYTITTLYPPLVSSVCFVARACDAYGAVVLLAATCH